MLNWISVMNFDQTIKMTTEWYKDFYTGCDDPIILTINNIKTFTSLANSKGLEWAI